MDFSLGVHTDVVACLLLLWGVQPLRLVEADEAGDVATLNCADIRTRLQFLFVRQVLLLVERNKSLNSVHQLVVDFLHARDVDILPRLRLLFGRQALRPVPSNFAAVLRLPVLRSPGGVRRDYRRCRPVGLNAAVLDTVRKDFVGRLVVDRGGVLHQPALLIPNQHLREQVKSPVEVLSLRRHAALANRL